MSRGENKQIMKIRILADSTSDIRQEEAKKLGIEVVPLGVSFGEETFLDGVTILGPDFYNRLQNDKTFPRTSQPAPSIFEKAFKEAMTAGDELIYIGASSGLSGTFNSARLAQENVGYSKIHIFDSLSSIQSLRLIVLKAVENRDAGKNVEEILEEAEYMKSHLYIVSALDTLSYLRKGGRLSAAASAIGNLLNLKVMVDLDKEGKIRVYGKCLGLRIAMKIMSIDVKRFEPDPKYTLSFGYTDKPDNMAIFEQKIMAAFPGFSKMESQIGPAIGSHVGPGGFDLAFVSKKERR